MTTMPTEDSGRLPFPFNHAVDKDEELKAIVLNALHWDPTVPLAGLDVSVEGGRVTLAGTVETDVQRKSAEANVRTLPDVTEIVNAITVKQ